MDYECVIRLVLCGIYSVGIPREGFEVTIWGMGTARKTGLLNPIPFNFGHYTLQAWTNGIIDQKTCNQLACPLWPSISSGSGVEWIHAIALANGTSKKPSGIFRGSRSLSGKTPRVG